MSTPSVTRNWSGRSYAIEGNQITAIEAWTIVGVSSQIDAQNQILNSSGTPIQRGDPHPDPEFAGLTVAHVNARSIAPLAWLVSISFTLSNNVAFPLNRILLPMELMIEPVENYEPVLQDLSGVTIQNSAKSPIDPQLTLNKGYRSFRARWYATFYNGSAATTYENAVNSDVITIPGIGTVTPGQAWCQKYGLATAVKSTDKYVAMDVILNVRTDIKDPWQPRVVDKGRYGWYSSGGSQERGPFCTKKGDFANEDVLLDGTGKPLDSRWYVWDGSSAQTPVAASLPVSGPAPIDADLSTPTVTILKFTRLRSVPFINILRQNN